MIINFAQGDTWSSHNDIKTKRDSRLRSHELSGWQLGEARGNNTSNKSRLASFIILLFLKNKTNKINIHHPSIAKHEVTPHPPPPVFYLSVWCAGKPVTPLHSQPSPIVSHLVYWLEQPWRTGHHLKPQTTGCNKLENSSNLRKVLPSPELPNSLSSYPGQKIKKSIRARRPW